VDGGPADLADIEAGDWIIAVDGMRIDEENTLERLIRSHKPGDRVAIVLWREGRERTVRVRLAGHPEDKDVAYLGVFYEAGSATTVPPGTD
jgi:S1-C subfamily serine protease